jgi:hypothetical protein
MTDVPTGRARKRKDPTFTAAVKYVAGSGLVMALVGALIFGPWAAFGVAVGASLATANLVFFGRLVEAFLAQKGNTAPWAILGVLKLLGLFAAAWIVLNTGVFSALSFAVGYAALPLGITLSTLFGKPPTDEPEGENPGGSGDPASPDGGGAPAPPAGGSPSREDVVDGGGR